MEDRWGLSVDVEVGTTPCASAGAGAWSGPLVFGIMDGHGGSRVSDHLAAHLPQLCCKALREAGPAADAQASALRNTFLDLDAAVVADDVASATVARTARYPGPGATAVVAALLPASLCAQHTHDLLLAVVGDSRAAVAATDGSLLAVTADQTPSVAEEAARVIAMGGTITSAAVFDTRPRVAGVLAISRAFGNAGMKPYVTAEPVITRVQVPHEGCTIVLGSDGLFDVVTTPEAVALACRPRERYPAGAVVQKARNLPGAMDNITCLTLRVGPAPPEAPLARVPDVAVAPVHDNVDLFATPPTQPDLPTTQDDRDGITPPVELARAVGSVMHGTKRRIDDISGTGITELAVTPLVEPAST